VIALALPAAQSYFVITGTAVDLSTADAIPLNKYGPDATATIAAILGVYKLTLPLQGLLVLFRYRSMIPFMLLTSLVLQIAYRVLRAMHPIVRADAQSIARLHPQGDFYVAYSSYYVGLVILGLTAVGLILSMIERRSLPSAGR
jgi:hypothetical protein